MWKGILTACVFQIGCWVCKPLKNWDRMKGLILRHLNAFCGSRNPWAATIHKPQSTSHKSTRWIITSRALRLMDCGSLIAAATIHEMDHYILWIVAARGLQQLQSTICSCRSLPGWVHFSLPQRRNTSPFIPPLKNYATWFKIFAFFHLFLKFDLVFPNPINKSWVIS